MLWEADLIHYACSKRTSSSVRSGDGWRPWTAMLSQERDAIVFANEFICWVIRTNWTACAWAGSSLSGSKTRGGNLPNAGHQKYYQLFHLGLCNFHQSS